MSGTTLYEGSCLKASAQIWISSRVLFLTGKLRAERRKRHGVAVAMESVDPGGGGRRGNGGEVFGEGHPVQGGKGDGSGGSRDTSAGTHLSRLTRDFMSFMNSGVATSACTLAPQFLTTISRRERARRDIYGRSQGKGQTGAQMSSGVRVIASPRNHSRVS